MNHVRLLSNVVQDPEVISVGPKSCSRLGLEAGQTILVCHCLRDIVHLTSVVHGITVCTSVFLIVLVISHCLLIGHVRCSLAGLSIYLISLKTVLHLAQHRYSTLQTCQNSWVSIGILGVSVEIVLILLKQNSNIFLGRSWIEEVH